MNSASTVLQTASRTSETCPVMVPPPRVGRGTRDSESQGKIRYRGLVLQQSQRAFLSQAWQHTTHRRMPNDIVWHSVRGMTMVFTIGPVNSGQESAGTRGRTWDAYATALQAAGRSVVHFRQGQ